MKKLVMIALLCFAIMQTYAQTKDTNILFVQAEEHFNAKNYNDALSKLALYENLSIASKEKSQVLKIQIYRELALKDKTQVNNYNNAVKELEKMYADGKKVNAEDLFRILKEQQEFSKDDALHNKENLSLITNEISIDGIKIGMNVEKIPSQVAANFDWSQGVKGQPSNQINYIPLIFMPKKMGTGGVFNFKMAGIQNITADDRTRKVIQVTKCIVNDKYKEKGKTGFTNYNQLIDELKAKYGESNVQVLPSQVNAFKVGKREIRTENYTTQILSQSVNYFLIYLIQNNETYSIMESMTIPDYYKIN